MRWAWRVPRDAVHQVGIQLTRQVRNRNAITHCANVWQLWKIAVTHAHRASGSLTARLLGRFAIDFLALIRMDFFSGERFFFVFCLFASSRFGDKLLINWLKTTHTHTSTHQQQRKNEVHSRPCACVHKRRRRRKLFMRNALHFISGCVAAVMVIAWLLLLVRCAAYFFERNFLLLSSPFAKCRRRIAHPSYF